eukprot:552326-Prymnesium_polylepis.1
MLCARDCAVGQSQMFCARVTLLIASSAHASRECVPTHCEFGTRAGVQRGCDPTHCEFGTHAQEMLCASATLLIASSAHAH